MREMTDLERIEQMTSGTFHVAGNHGTAVAVVSGEFGEASHVGRFRLRVDKPALEDALATWLVAAQAIQRAFEDQGDEAAVSDADAGEDAKNG